MEPQPSSREEEALVTWFEQSIPAESRLALMEKALQGGVPAADVRSVEMMVGLPEGSLGGVLDSLRDAFDAQVAGALTAAGLPQEQFDSFTEYVNEHRSDELTEVLRLHVHARTTAGYAELVRDYFQNASPVGSPEEWQASGLKTRVAPDGTRLVAVNGMEMPVSVAARMGWL
jgi:hypothetical protein